MIAEWHSGEFDQHSFASAYPPGVENNFWNLARNRVVQDELERAVRAGLIDRDDHILDVGCGAGIVVKHLRERGWTVFGVDPGRSTVSAGLEHVVWMGQQASQLDEAFRETVRCILLLDVIEHVADDVAFMSELSKSFPACDCFIISVPARSEVWSNYDDHYGHFRRYDRKHYSDAMRRAGLTTLHKQYFFHSLYIVAAIINLLGLKREVVITPTKCPLLDRLIGWVLHLEARLLPSFVPGLSLIGTAVRR